MATPCSAGELRTVLVPHDRAGSVVMRSQSLRDDAVRAAKRNHVAQDAPQRRVGADREIVAVVLEIGLQDIQRRALWPTRLRWARTKPARARIAVTFVEPGR